MTLALGRAAAALTAVSLRGYHFKLRPFGQSLASRRWGCSSVVSAVQRRFRARALFLETAQVCRQQK
eukprot:CAMPEP_0175186650 /NCGR_PEP_ID=MMETSP0093-20121207/2502_1 /TAXON_ID=311494 /ORGANISM="Alexandrium monilatum, Strain CCMP3105" /LENGTH=66 /DNA_ID=CAMNT_0016479381 /DNA_START=39 /DNA_END=236 /DNA_ORIENTATION=-